MRKLVLNSMRSDAKLIAWGLLLSLLLGMAGCAFVASTDASIAPGFVDVSDYIPSIRRDVRYAGTDNFVGEPITGYEAPRIYLTHEAALALQAVQTELSARGLGLKVYDGYRPQRAVDHFVRWAQDLDDTRMRDQYYPAVAKEHLFRDGYIAQRSGHSRGSTVDLTLIELPSGRELDMGSSWDYFDPVSWPDSTSVSLVQFANRMLLQEIMRRHGFNPITTEWWHFTLQDEPYPDHYFNFVIR